MSTRGSAANARIGPAATDAEANTAAAPIANADPMRLRTSLRRFRCDRGYGLTLTSPRHRADIDVIAVATDQVNREVEPYASSSAMRMRLLMRPLDS